MGAAELKERYASKWALSNAREKLVLALLEAYLPPGFSARLTGLGAGSRELIPRSYSNLLEAFDITVYYNGSPVAFVDVTGADTIGMRKSECRGRCVGEWKLEKARKHGVISRLWIAFVNDDTGSTYWLSMRWLEQHSEAPFVSRCRLYSNERFVYCVPPAYWRRLRHFLNWLTTYGRVYAKSP